MYGCKSVLNVVDIVKPSLDQLVLSAVDAANGCKSTTPYASPANLNLLYPFSFKKPDSIPLVSYTFKLVVTDCSSCCPGIIKLGTTLGHILADVSWGNVACFIFHYAYMVLFGFYVGIKL
nr:MAG TPA: hypothetical protein [Caudoviricetes sp.]